MKNIGIGLQATIEEPAVLVPDFFGAHVDVVVDRMTDWLILRDRKQLENVSDLERGFYEMAAMTAMEQRIRERIDERIF